MESRADLCKVAVLIQRLGVLMGTYLTLRKSKRRSRKGEDSGGSVGVRVPGIKREKY
jgi:hypothetical protein